MLLPSWMFVRRAYAAPVIWSALTAHERGMGYRRIALRLRLPATTVRDWLRALRRVEPALLRRLARSVAVTTSAVLALERLSPPRPAWQFAVLVTGGRLLNTSPLHGRGTPRSARPP